MSSDRHVVILAACLCLTAAQKASCGDAWPAAHGAFRRELRVDGAAGEPVTATTTVFLDARFAGFSLLDAQGAARPFALLNALGSRVSVHFEAKGCETLFLCPSATAALPPPGLDNQSGLRHLARGYDGREVTSAAQFEALWRDGAFQGGAFEENVYSAYNPFGPNAKVLHRYEGYLRVEKAGETAFCVASTDASFLLLNGKEVAAWPGRHAVRGGLDGSQRGTVALQPGLYRFQFLHANGGGDSFAIAAWVPPGEKRHVVIPAECFTRAAYARVGPLAGRDGARQAEFLWENRYMVTLRNRALYELSFEAVRPPNAPGATYAWDFGDGTRGDGPAPEHLYFADGDVRVALTATYADGSTATSAQTVRLAPRYGQSENDDARALLLLDQAVAQEKARGIQPQGYALISQGYYFFLKEPQAAAFAERVLAAVDRMPEADRYPVLNELALGVQQVDEQYELSERCFRALLDHVKDPKQRASAALHGAGMLNLCLNRPKDARDLLASIRREDLADWEPRLLDIYLADTALVLDDVATARARYQAIPKTNAEIAGSRVDRNVLFDYNSRYFRLQNLLSQRLYRESLAELDQLEWDLPEERASPRMNLLKVQALVGNNQPRKAVVCLQRALIADVDASYTPALRLELAKIYLSLNQLAQAKHQVTLIRKESPWTQEEIEARKVLEEIERKIGEASP